MANLFAWVTEKRRGLPGFAASRDRAKLLRLCAAVLLLSGIFGLVSSEPANAAPKLSQPDFTHTKTNDLGKLL